MRLPVALALLALLPAAPAAAYTTVADGLHYLATGVRVGGLALDGWTVDAAPLVEWANAWDLDPTADRVRVWVEDDAGEPLYWACVRAAPDAVGCLLETRRAGVWTFVPADEGVPAGAELAIGVYAFADEDGGRVGTHGVAWREQRWD